MVPTPTMGQLLNHYGVHQKTVIWNRGVNHDLFRPRSQENSYGPRPYWLCAGRVAVEKNIEAFLKLDLQGSGNSSSSILGTRISLDPLALARATQGHQRTCYFVSSKQTILIIVCLRKFAQELHTVIHSLSPQETVCATPPMISKKSAI